MREIILLFLQAVCCLLCAEHSMANTEEIMANILNLTEAEFFSEDNSILTQREFQFVDIDFWGVVVNTPRQILTDRHDKLPLLIAMRYSGDRGWDVRLKDNTILVGTNLQDGTVHFAKAFISERELTSRWREKKAPHGPKPPQLPIRSAGIRLVDAKRRLHIKWNSGIWALGVIYYDWCSNTVVVELKGDGPPQPSPAPSVHPTPNPNAGATEKWLFGLLKRKKLVFPSYLPNSKTPKLTKPGLSFVIDTKFKDGIQLTVHGAFSTITKAHYIPETITTHIFADGKKHKVGAVVPLTLAIVGLDWDVPIRFDCAIPVYSNQKIQPGAPLQGYFALDVLAKAGNKLPAGDYVAYVVMEGNIYGPVKFKWSSPGDKP